MPENKHIVLAYAYGPKNSGDLAINLGAIEIIASLYPQENITLISRFAGNSSGFHDTKRFLHSQGFEVHLLPCPFNYDRHVQVGLGKILTLASETLRYCYIRLALCANASLSEVPAVTALRDADLILCNGGNLFYWNRCSHSLTRLLGLTFPVHVARLLGKPYGFLPQSISEIGGLGKAILNPLFKDARFLTFRESRSRDLFHNTFDINTRTPLIPDLAFFIARQDDEAAERLLSDLDLQPGAFVAMTVRTERLGDVGSLSRSEVANTISFLARLIRRISDTLSLKTLLVCQTRADIPSTRKLYDALSSTKDVHMVEVYNPFVLRSVYKSSAALVAMRLHSAIFALSVGTPVIGLYRKEWGPKMPGTLSDMSVGSQAFELGSVDVEQVLKALEQKLDEREAIQTAILGSIAHHRERLCRMITDAVHKASQDR